jgi:hypothetical protein
VIWKTYVEFIDENGGGPEGCGYENDTRARPPRKSLYRSIAPWDRKAPAV